MSLEALKKTISDQALKMIKSLEAPLRAGTSRSSEDRLGDLVGAIPPVEDFIDHLAACFRDLRSALDRASERKAHLLAAMQKVAPIIQPQ